jgi:hypothetical protein
VLPAYVPFYNNIPLHSSLNYVSPIDVLTACMRNPMSTKLGKIPVQQGGPPGGVCVWDRASHGAVVERLVLPT